MSEENAEIVRRALDGWNRGDVDAWLENVHPEIEWVSEVAQRVEGAETVYRGPAEMRSFWDEWHAVWDLTIEIDEIREREDTVAALGRIKTRGEASGIDLEQSVAYVFEFTEGLVRKARAYWDVDEGLEAAGLSK